MPHQHGNLGQINGFQLLKFLGKGTFGAVYQARREADGKIYAIKKVDTRRMPLKERQESVNEIRVLASIQGAHVITFYEAFVESDDAVCSGVYPSANVYLQGALKRQSFSDLNPNAHSTLRSSLTVAITCGAWIGLVI